MIRPVRGHASLRLAGSALLLLSGLACGSRTPLADRVDEEPLERPLPGPEVCDGLDQDFDGAVDEDFRDDAGRYVHASHCGGCDRPCDAVRPAEIEVACAVLEETAVCAATRCEPGFAPSSTGRCVPLYDRLCLPCTDDGDCGDFELARCDDVGGELRCVVGCDFGCPDGYACAEDRCVPLGGSCACGPEDRFDLACALIDPEGARCPGAQTCELGTLSSCEAPLEVCDAVDNDCDGIADEGFVDERGAYLVDPRHCGECGVDCTVDRIPEGDLVCGGDPFAPQCVLACPDAADGIMPGDRIDADRDIATGCECLVTALDDEPGPVGARGEMLDVNCDGADGIVTQSYYVAPDGDDGGPGSPTRPLRTLAEATRRAGEEAASGGRRVHVFVAAGSYPETMILPDGVKVHGGYRRDFLALEPAGFRVEVRAPLDTMAPGGAALIASNAGRTDTVAEWMTFVGRDALGPSMATFGAVVVDAGPALRLSELVLRSGVPGAGADGETGEAGEAPPGPGEDGEAPRGAVEDGRRECTEGDANTVEGGEGASNRCGDQDVSGGRGGSSRCPSFAAFQPSGMRGRGTAIGGNGGPGGQDSAGPIMGGPSCPEGICCGLADFTVPSDFRGPQSGIAGGDGRSGTGGRGCDDPLGALRGDEWIPATATNGTNGTPGAGGGGGGAGGGSDITWVDGECEFADGLGGGGGGGGAGGCGGSSGTPGTSGGPSVALLVRYIDRDPRAFVMRDVDLFPSDGGRGGDGGAGGDGGRGSAGGFGQGLELSERDTPTTSAPFPGGRGGRGGNGGPGGGGGAGCGGGSIGVWVTGGRVDVSAWRADNDFLLGLGGLPGRGGGGGAPGGDGAEGGATDVVLD